MNARVPAALACLCASLFFASCQTPPVRDAAPDGARAILEQLDARGENRTIALEDDIRGAAHPPCSLMEAFLKALRDRPETRSKLVERDLLDLIRDDFRVSQSDAFDEQTRARLGALLGADTVVIGWGGEQEETKHGTDQATGQTVVTESYWYISYFHMVAIDIPTGCVIASWSYFPNTASAVARKVGSWMRQGDSVVVQPTLDDEVKGALLVGLHRSSGGRYRVVVRDLLGLLMRETERPSSDFFSPQSQSRLKISGATVIVGADSAMGLNLRAVEVATGAIIAGLPGPLSEHVQTAYSRPLTFSL